MTELTSVDTAPMPRVGVTVDRWQNYARRVDIISTVVATILEMLAENPMIAPAVGPEFCKEAKGAAEELIRLRDEVAE